MRRISGRANSSKVTRALTGLPGRPDRHPAPRRRRAACPAACGSARNRASPGARSCRARGRGARPTRRRRRSAGRPRRTRLSCCSIRTRVVRHALQGDHRRRLGDGRRQGDPVGVVDLARGQRRARRLQLVAGRQDCDPRAAAHGQLPHAQRGKQAQGGGRGSSPAGSRRRRLACRGPCDGRRRPAPWRARPRPHPPSPPRSAPRRPRRAASERRS